MKLKKGIKKPKKKKDMNYKKEKLKICISFKKKKKEECTGVILWLQNSSYNLIKLDINKKKFF